MAYQKERVDSKSLNGIEERAHLEFRKTNDLITTVCGRVADDHQGVNMTLW